MFSLILRKYFSILLFIDKLKWNLFISMKMNVTRKYQKQPLELYRHMQTQQQQKRGWPECQKGTMNGLTKGTCPCTRTLGESGKPQRPYGYTQQSCYAGFSIVGGYFLVLAMHVSTFQGTPMVVTSLMPSKLTLSLNCHSSPYCWAVSLGTKEILLEASPMKREQGDRDKCE